MELYGVVLKSYIRSSTLPCLATERDYEYFFVTLEVYLTTLFSKIFCFGDFFGGQEGTGQTEYGQRDFSRKIFFR